MMLKIILLALFSSIAYSQVEGVRDIIKDPSVSKRCKSLIHERDEKIHTQQKINSLILRNKKLLKRAQSNQVSAIKRLEITQTSLENNLRLTKYRIKAMEENIVRKGCPGISL